MGPRTPPSCTATPAPPPTASQVTPFINPPQTVDSAGWHRRPPPPARPAGRTSKRSCRRVRSSSPKCLWPCRRARIAAGPGQPRVLGHRFVVFVVLDIGSVGAACFPNSSRRAARPLLARAVSTAANESRAAQSVGLGSGVGGIGAGAPAISAGMGQATFVGVLSVPTAWAGAAPSASPPVAMRFAGTAPYRLRRLVRTRAYRR